MKKPIIKVGSVIYTDLDHKWLVLYQDEYGILVRHQENKLTQWFERNEGFDWKLWRKKK